MVIVEKSFPRGGVTNTEARTAAVNTSIIFGATQQKIKKSKPKVKENENTAPLEDADAPLESVSAEQLNYDTIQDGMNIMGIIKSVDALYLNVELPGRMLARVSALEISDAYTKSAKEFLQNAEVATEQFKPLETLYSVGQIVYAHVQEVKKTNRGRTLINLSLKPSEVHADLQHASIKKGCIFNAAVEEVQEHGYIMESGIRGLRTFVPLNKSKQGHMVGELIYLKVEKITHDQSASTCICKEVKVESIKIKSQNELNLDYILPTSIVQFTVSKILKDGLQGTIMNESFTAYVNEHQLEEALALPEDYESNRQFSARVLYVMPLTKLVYLTLNLRLGRLNADDAEEQQVEALKTGDIIENARVHHLGTGGVILVLNNKLKGLLSYKTIKANYKGNYDQDALLVKYAKKTKHKVRILYYDIMDSLYICSDDANAISETIFTLNDLQPGEFVTGTVQKRDELINGYILQVGKVRGIIEQIFLAPNSAKHWEEQTKVRCRVIAVNASRKVVYLTNRAEYLAKNCRVLCSLEQAKVNSSFVGTVVKNDAAYVLVRFFNNLKGVLHKHQLGGLMSAEYDTFSEGQTMKFRIVSKINEQIALTLPEDTFALGEICPIEVVNVLDSGLEIKIAFPTNTADDDEEEEVLNEDFKGLVPMRLLSDYVDLLAAQKRIMSAQTVTKAVCMIKNIFSLRDVPYFQQNLTKTWSDVKVGDILRAHVKNVKDEVVELLLPISKYNKLVKVHLKMLLVNAIDSIGVELAPEQVVYVKVLSKEPTTRTITISGKLTDVWDKQLSTSAQYLESYLSEVADIKQALKQQKAPIAKYTIGAKVTASFKGVHAETHDWIYEVEKTKVAAVLKPSICGKKAQLPKVGDKQEFIVLWIDYSNDLLLVSNKACDIQHISTEKTISENLVGKSGINAKVLLKLDNIVICSLKKGPNPLIYCPVRLHCNDFVQSCSNALREGDFCKLAFVHENQPIAVPESTWKLWKDIKRKIQQDEEAAVKRKRIKLKKLQQEQKSEDVIPLEEATKKKRKLNEEIPKSKKAKTKTSEKEAAGPIPIKQVKQDKVKKADSKIPNDKDAATSITAKETKEKKKTEAADSVAANASFFFEDKTPDNLVKDNLVAKQKPEPKYLSGVSNFWNTDLSQLNTSRVVSSDDEDDDDDDEEEEAETTQNKKKRLSAKEKFKQQREEEARLREIEEKNADPNQLPETVDQFDRLVLGGPNNSKNWINYMVFHLQSAEIDRAREVARRALKTISFRETNELLNIWIALLNLELRYGNKETFDETMKESLICNDPLKIYLRTVEIFNDAKKTSELCDIIGVITKKFRSEPEVWRVSANAYYTVGMPERAQQLLHRALACLPEREHVNMIVAFANIYQKHGNNELAQTLLDQIVTSYPKRVDVWTQYVDMLVKAELIEPARNLLERAIIQKIPLKKMRTIFKKYLEFEERFGDDESVQKVKQLAVEFVNNSTTL